MKRIFGTKAPQAPAPSMDDVTGRMSERATTMDAKIDEIDKKLVKYKQQIASARTAAAKNAAKQQALRLLKQKRVYEQQRDQMFAQQMNLENAQFMTEQLKNTSDQVAVMKDAHKQIAKQMKHFSIDDVELLQEQMQDLAYEQEEIQEVLGRSFAVQDDVNEDELFAELDLIEDELALEPDVPASGLPAFLEEPDLPAVPTSEVNPPPIPERPLNA